MRRFFLLAFLILGLLFFVVYSILFLKLKPEHLRLNIEAALSAQFHSQVELGAVFLSWKGIHPVLRAQSLTIKGGREGRQTLLHSGSFEIQGGGLMSLFRRRSFTGKMVLRDVRVIIERDEAGYWNWTGINSPPGAYEFMGGDSGYFRDVSIQMSDVSVHYTDRSELPFFHAGLNDLKVSIAPARSGGFHISINRAESGSRASAARLRVLAGRLLAYVYFGKTGSIKFEVLDPLREARWTAAAHLKAASSKELFSGFNNISGTLSLRAQGGSQGVHPEKVKRNLILKGSVVLEDGVYHGRNAVNDILRGMASVPGFTMLMHRSFPGDLETLVDASGTPFKTVSCDIQVEREHLFLQNLKLNHLYFNIEADAEKDLTRRGFDLKGKLFLSDLFSNEVILRSRDADVLLNQKGRVEVPFSMKGGSTEAQPDLFFIANRLIQIRGQQLASRGVQKINQFMEVQRT